MGIRQQPQQLRPVGPGPAGVLDILRGNGLAMVSSELLQSVTGTTGVLLRSGGAKVGANEHEDSLDVSGWVFFFGRIT
ncbi:hypothetical protein D3C85_1394700 [compost metagenome]